METVVVVDLIPHIDATFRTIASRQARLIEGFSMGGYGDGSVSDDRKKKSDSQREVPAGASPWATTSDGRSLGNTQQPRPEPHIPIEPIEPIEDADLRLNLAK